MTIGHRVRSHDYHVTMALQIFNIYVKFLNLLFLNKFITILLTLLLLLITSLSLALNIFRANFLVNLVIFKIKISSIVTLLKL